MLIKKHISGYEGFYSVDSEGNVHSESRVDNLGRLQGGYILSPVKVAGYLYVSLYKDGIEERLAVHRLVCSAFYPNPENKSWVNHKNGNKEDNRKDNLEWSTPSDNNLHAYATKLKTAKKGAEHKRSTAVDQYDLKGNYITTFGGVKEAARILEIGSGGISNCINGVTKTSCGFVFLKSKV